MRFEVQVIEEDVGLCGQDWAFVRHDDELTFCIKQRAAESPARLKAALEEAWATDRRRRPSMPWPTRMAAS